MNALKIPTFIALLLLGLNGFSQTPPPHTHGQWGSVIEFDIIPVAVANLPDGRLVTWSSKYHDAFDMNDGYTFTQVFDPLGGPDGTGGVLQRSVTETFHDMFCPGINNLSDGRLLVTGGSSDEKTSIYDPKTGIWTSEEDMKIARGYQGAVTLPDGSAFTIGGSWNDAPPGGRDAEIWTLEEGWRELPGIRATLLWNQNDENGEPEGVYRLDNHAWLWAAPNGKILHAGPGETMHWIDVNGNNGQGSVQVVGRRGDDYMSMNGNTSMFDIGKLLKVGGSASYSSGSLGNENAYVIEFNDGDNVTVTPTANKPEHARVYVSSVVLPNGEVLVMGGLDHAEVFVDDIAYLSAEMYNPVTNSFRTLASMEVPRTYHSAAILLNDGRVFMGGGGLCGEGCEANHLDAEIFSPPYLFDSNGDLAERPTVAAPDNVYYNSVLTVTGSSDIDEFVFMRMSSATHSINNEQRRVPVDFTKTNGYYNLNVPGANVMPPGYYMLFAIKDGVPSISEAVLVGTGDSRINDDNLLVEFNFFEGNGDSIRDTSGNNNHGIIKEYDDSGAEVPLREEGYWSVNGLSGNALEMDGMEFNSNSLVEIPSSPSLQSLTNQITVMAWVNRNDGSIMSNGEIPNVGIFTHDYSSFFIGYHADKFKMEFFTEGNGHASLYTNVSYTPGVWEHLVGTYDGTHARLYVNGEEIYQVEVTGNLLINTNEPVYNTFTLSGFYDRRPGPVVPGGNSSGVTDELDGRMDNFRLYNVALTPEEIQRIYADEHKVTPEVHPCDEFEIVYEINGERTIGVSQISVRDGEQVTLSLNAEGVEYIVKGPDGAIIPDGVIDSIHDSGEYTVTAVLTEIGPADDMAIADFCSEHPNGFLPGEAKNAIDGMAVTYWHTEWYDDRSYPHFIDLDLGAETEIFGFEYLPRQYHPNELPQNQLNGTIKDYEIYISDSKASLGLGTPISAGEWAYNPDLKTVEFPKTTGRYVRLLALSEGNGKVGASAAELRVIVKKTIECENTLTINVGIPKTYTYDGAWSPSDPSGVATEFDDIIIESGDAMLTRSTLCNSLTVEPGASLVLEDIHGGTTVNLTVKMHTTLNSTPTSFSSLIDNGYLTGLVEYNRYINKVGTSVESGNDLIASPVSMNFDTEFVTTNHGVLAKHPSENGIYSFGPFNVATAAFENFNIGTDNLGSIPLAYGEGYRVGTEPNSDGVVRFMGKTTKIPISINMTKTAGGTSWNLVGNPYPSYLDFEVFLDTNANDLDSANGYEAVYGYNRTWSDSWVVLNRATLIDPAAMSSIIPGQGFFVKARPGGSRVMFTPEMRIVRPQSVSGNQNPNMALSKLILSSEEKSDATSIYFIDGTTRGLDVGYDARTFEGVNIDFTVFTRLVDDNSDRDFAIQSLPYEDFNGVVVPLGLKVKSGTNLKISIDEDFSTIPANIYVYLEDRQENAFVLLNDRPYRFSSTSDMNGAGRFNVHYSDKPLIEIEGPSPKELQIYATIMPKALIVSGRLDSETTAYLYDIRGRLIFSKLLNLNAVTNTIDISTVGTGVYIVKVSNDEQTKTQKIVIK